jgi:hypothetical protein
MRDRHLPRVCGHCHAPMARQQDACWRCGTRWASEETPRTELQLIVGGAPEEARVQTDRWTEEGGCIGRDAVEPAPAAVARR